MKNEHDTFDPSNTVAISAHSFEESPFIERITNPNLVRGVYAGRYMIISAGEDVIEKYWCLRQKALMFDVPEKPIDITGPDVIQFLEKVLSRRISTMTEGRGYYAIACTPNGGIFMDGVVFRLGPDHFRYVQADGNFETWLLAHSGGFDVSITDPHARVLQIQGPASIDIMSAASNGAIDETMKYFRSGYFDLGGQRMYVSRTGYTNELGFEVYCDASTTDYLALWDFLMACGAPHGMEYSSIAAMNIRRIEAGIMDNLTDMDPTMTPYEAGLGSFIDMDKGDFVGRDALLKKDTRSCFFGLTCAGAIPASGSIVMDATQQVGRVTLGRRSPTLGVGIGYVRFFMPGDWPGKSLSLRLPDGTTEECQIVELPFFDQDRRIVRGLDRAIPERPLTTLSEEH